MEERFLEGSSASAKISSAVGKTMRGKGTKWMVLVDGVAVFIWVVPLREKLYLRRARSPRSKSPAPQAGRANAIMLS